MVSQNILILWLSSALLIYVTAVLVPGFQIKSFPRALIAAIIIGFLNASIRPILIFITIPINILTLGLFTLVVNAIILRLSAAILKGFDIKGWMSAVLAALTMVVLQFSINFLFAT